MAEFCKTALAAGTAALLACMPARALNILLVNDDGCQAPGILAVRQALIDAGHQVITVGPASNQSGSGAAYAVPDGSTSLVVEPLKNEVYCVHRVKPGTHAIRADAPGYLGSGSPVDATALGLKIVLPEAGVQPDLVVSGANFGENLSDSIPHSGTVMNALYAARRGVPAIALSVGVKFSEARSGFPSTLASFPRAGAFLARLLAQLDKDRKTGEPLLPVGQPLNINYPALSSDEKPAGVRLTQVGTVDSFTFVYARAADGTVSIQPGAPDRERPDLAADAETPALLQGYVTISPLAVGFRLAPEADAQFKRNRKGLEGVRP
jgi:5'-nucleotidase